MEQEQIKLEIEKCFIKAMSFCPKEPLYWRQHPIRVIQAVKSIIGIDLSGSNTRILNWLVSYCDELVQNEIQIPKKKQVAHLALEDLKTSLIEKDKDASIKFLSDILTYSDGRHILEFLLEISLMQRGESMLFVWSAIRMNLFLSSKFADRILLLCGHAILSCDFYSTSDAAIESHSYLGRSWRSFEEGCMLDEISRESLVRESSIQMNVNTFVNSCMPIEKVSLKKSNSKIWRHASNDRKWISSFINSDCELNPQNILLLDATRTLYKNNPKMDKSQLLLQLDRSMAEVAC
ncbi:MAG: hypothetical protein CBD58_04185 [bacterium TMED198]|nr:MAG: hypothetical protein CBD58_04185 [bacterium TMED198]|tara:strand:+ start:79 stop:954 length:876 start_codon:yes stop_codon:yes gene_type:complete